jgi:hypothetical protein
LLCTLIEVEPELTFSKRSDKTVEWLQGFSPSMSAGNVKLSLREKHRVMWRGSSMDQLRSGNHLLSGTITQLFIRG